MMLKLAGMILLCLVMLYSATEIVVSITNYATYSLTVFSITFIMSYLLWYLLYVEMTTDITI